MSLKGKTPIRGRGFLEDASVSVWLTSESEVFGKGGANPPLWLSFISTCKFKKKMAMNKLFYEQLCEEEKDLLETLTSIQQLKRRYAPNGNTYSNSITVPSRMAELNDSSNHVMPPSEYDRSMSQSSKSLFALNSLKKGTAEDVVNQLHKIDATISQEEARKFVPFMLSKLYKKGIIGAKKQGFKNLYFSFHE